MEEVWNIVEDWLPFYGRAWVQVLSIVVCVKEIQELMRNGLEVWLESSRDIFDPPHSPTPVFSLYEVGSDAPDGENRSKDLFDQDNFDNEELEDEL